MSGFFVFLAWLIGGFINGVSGMGAALIAVPLVALFVPTQELIPSSCLIITAMYTHMSYTFHRDCRMDSLKKLLLGSIPGSFVGLNILLYISSSILQLCTGLVMLAFVLLNLCKRENNVQRTETYPAGLIAGFASGVLNTSISFGGPPLGAYALYSGWTQKECMGTMSVFSFFAFIVACIAHASAGLYTSEVFIWALWGIPGAILGLLCAVPATKHINQVTFKRILLFIIACSGLNCFIRGLIL